MSKNEDKHQQDKENVNDFNSDFSLIDVDPSGIPQLRTLTIATVVFFKCNHTEDIIVNMSATEIIGAGDIITCHECNVKRLVLEVTNYRKETS